MVLGSASAGSHDAALPGLRPRLHAREIFSARRCTASCSFNPHSKIVLEEDAFAEQVMQKVSALGLGLVTRNRKQATALLTKMAVLTCVPGDVVETGVFTGGSSAVIMRVLMDMDECDRKYWAFDSFEGLPDPKAEDASGTMQTGARGAYTATQETFTTNMKALDAWDDRVRVVKGWFNESIPSVVDQIASISFLRLDGDLYQSTMDVLNLLYDKMGPGGCACPRHGHCIVACLCLLMCAVRFASRSDLC